MKYLQEEKIWLKLGLKDSSKRLILNLQNVYYLLKSSCKLVSLGLLNNSGIDHNNENQTLYDVNSRQTQAQAQRWRNSYLLKPLNLWNGATIILRVDDSTYQWPTNILHTMASFSSTTTLTTRHKRLGHTNFTFLKIFLHHLEIPFVDDSKNSIYDNCNRAKMTKIYHCELQQRI